MNRTLILMGLIAAMACPAVAQRSERLVRVRLASIQLPPGVLASAMLTARNLLAQAGVRLEWAPLREKTAPLPIAGCMDRGIDSIDVEIVESAPDGASPFALGAAHPFTSSGLRVRLFHDRILRLTGMLSWAVAGRITGHALAHEIGHILIGRLEHSDSGLMSGRWDRNAVAVIRHGLLALSAADIELIHSNLDDPRRCAGEALVSALPSRHSSPSMQNVALARD